MSDTIQVLAGKRGAECTWSIEKPHRSDADKDKEFGPDVYYAVLKRYVMTKEQLEENCYPMPDPKDKVETK